MKTNTKQLLTRSQFMLVCTPTKENIMSEDANSKQMLNSCKTNIKNTMDTDTPRTDDEETRIQCDLSSTRLYDWNMAYHEMKSHAEELEREINEMTTKQIELVNHMKLYRGQINNEGKHTASDALANSQRCHGVAVDHPRRLK